MAWGVVGLRACRAVGLYLLAGAALLGGAPAAACTICDSEVGVEVRAGIFDGDFGLSVLATVLPVAVCAGVGAALYAWPLGDE